MPSTKVTLVRHEGSQPTHTLTLQNKEERDIVCRQFQTGDLNFSKLVQSIAAYRARYGAPKRGE